MINEYLFQARSLNLFKRFNSFYLTDFLLSLLLLLHCFVSVSSHHDLNSDRFPHRTEDLNMEGISRQTISLCIHLLPFSFPGNDINPSSKLCLVK